MGSRLQRRTAHDSLGDLSHAEYMLTNAGSSILQLLTWQGSLRLHLEIKDNVIFTIQSFIISLTLDFYTSKAFFSNNLEKVNRRVTFIAFGDIELLTVPIERLYLGCLVR